jgi:hypothetical protein
VAVTGPNAGVSTGDEIRITPIAREPLEPARERNPVSLGDPTCATHVLPGEIRFASASRIPREFGQSIDAFLGDAHAPGFSSDAQRRSATPTADCSDDQLAEL